MEENEIKSVVFHTPHKSYLLHLKEEGKEIVDGGARTVPCKMVKFVDGIYQTSDEEEIKMIRDSGDYKHRKIFEITGEELLGPKQPVIRGPINSSHLEKEMGIKREESKVMLAEGITKCDFPGCTKEFTQDFAGRKARMHKLSHRKKQ